MNCKDCLTFPICRNKIIEGATKKDPAPIGYKKYMILKTYRDEIEPKCNVIFESIPFVISTDDTLAKHIMKQLKIKKKDFK